MLRRMPALRPCRREATPVRARLVGASSGARGVTRPRIPALVHAVHQIQPTGLENGGFGAVPPSMGAESMRPARSTVPDYPVHACAGASCHLPLGYVSDRGPECSI